MTSEKPQARLHSRIQRTFPTMIALLALLVGQSLSAQATFFGQFQSPDENSNSTTISEDGDRAALLSDQGDTILQVSFEPSESTQENPMTFDVGTLRIDLASAISEPRFTPMTLKLTGSMAPFDSVVLDLPLRFRIRPTEIGAASTLQRLAQSALPVIEQDGSPFTLEFELLPEPNDAEAQVIKTMSLTPGLQSLRIVANLRPLQNLHWDSTAQFSAPPATGIQGNNTAHLVWGQPASGFSEPNRYEIETRSANATTEVPFLLGSFVFYNSTISTDSIPDGIALQISPTINDQSEPATTVFDLQYEGTPNTDDVIASADTVRITNPNRGRPIPGTDLFLYLRFDNPTFVGFTEGDGFGVMENQEATAEVWGLLSTQSELSASELATRLQPILSDAPSLSHPRWVRSPQTLPRTGARDVDIQDYNGDTIPDIAVVRTSGIQVWAGTGTDAPFQAGVAAASTGTRAAAFDDFNGDIYPDVFVLSDDPGIWLNNGSGGFTRTMQTFETDTSGDVVAGDLDADGDADLVIASATNGTLTIYTNQGDGTFSAGEPQDLKSAFSSQLRNLNMELADFNSDGALDLAMAVVTGSDFGSNDFPIFDESAFGAVWSNDGQGQLKRTTPAITHNAPVPLIIQSNGNNGIGVGDIDGDDDLDIVIPFLTSGDGVPGFLINLPNGFFWPRLVNQIGIGASQVLVQDLNADGLDDIVSGGGFAATAVYLAAPDGSFSRTQSLSSATPTAFATGDLDEDGQLDMVVATEQGVELWVRGTSGGREFAPNATDPVEIEDPIVRDVIAQTVGRAPDSLTRLDLYLIQSLHFHRNGLTELNLPLGLVNLESLSISHNSISDFRLPPDITKLRSFSHSNPSAAFQEGISRVTFGPEFHTLETFGMLGLGATEIVFEGEMPNLHTMGLWANRMRDLSFMAQTPNLRILNLGDNGIRDLVIPIGVRRLDELTLNMNPLRSSRKPRGMEIGRIFGPTGVRPVEYDTDPIIRSHRLVPGEGFVLNILSTDGLLDIETSKDLSTWNTIGQVQVDEWNAVYFMESAPEEPQLFFRASRRGEGEQTQAP